MKNHDDEKGRQPYEKPQLRSFPLAAGDVLAKDWKLAPPSSEFEDSERVTGGFNQLGS
jgi:hypothetical protein